MLEVNGKLAWTLEAKAPLEDISNSKHVEQAYSYAIHSEVRVPYFALCNGRDFALYHISLPKPILHFPINALSLYWENLKMIVGPDKVLDVDLKLAKDFGLHLKRLGFHEFQRLYFYGVPIRTIGKMGNDHYMTGGSVQPDQGDTYVATFDFDHKAMLQLQNKIPEKAFNILVDPLTDAMRQVNFADASYYVNINCRVGEKLAENANEIFLPLWVNEFL